MKRIMTLAAPLAFLLAATVADAQETQQPSAADCDIIAERASRNAAGMGDGRIARGAARGAIVGGVLGRSDGAKRGAALGAIAGGARRARARNDAYDRAFDDCMHGITPYQ